MAKTRLRTGLLLIIGGLVAGYSLLQLPAARAGTRPQNVVPPGAESQVAPLTSAPSAGLLTAPPAEDSLAPLGISLKSYLAKRPGKWGLYIVDLTTGETTGQGAQQMFPAASTIKLPLALFVYDEIAQGRASLDEPIKYQRSDWQDGAGYLAAELSPGESRTVGQLVEALIRHSDNVAKNMLMRRFTEEGLFAWIRAQGGQVELRDDGDGGLIYTNAETLALMMGLLYRDDAFQHPELRQQLLTYLQTTIYKDRSAAGVPAGVKVAHKVGNLPAVVNDVALVWAPRGPFILVALSEGVLDEPGLTTIKNLTAQTYQFLEKHHQTP